MTMQPDLLTPQATPETLDAVDHLLRTVNRRMVVSRFAKSDDFDAMSVADDIFAIGPDGAWLEREDFIARCREAGPPVAVQHDEVHMQADDISGVVHGVVTVVGPGGTSRKIRYTDAYIRTGGEWRLVASQETELADGVSPLINKGTAPAHRAWTGSDPTGDDRAVLQALNERYVASFREANVGWYDVHLAPDYVVTFGDGSFHDRAAALADFAIPYFADTIASFPVDNVSIRLFGDLAIIHAENDYRLKDGRAGINRYTDIWRKHGDRWQCLSAHITVHQAPAHR